VGIINHYKGLNSERVIYNFNGKLKDNLDIQWDYASILNGSAEINPDYEVQEDDIIIIQETPGEPITLLSIIFGVVVFAGTSLYAAEQMKIAEKELQKALDRIGKENQKKDITSIPQLRDARNESAEGKSAPIILGKHLFAPYFLSEPYMKPEGEDGKDLYWYAAFLCGQDGLCFEKIRNGTTELVTDFSENTNNNSFNDNAQYGRFVFQDPGGDNPPFYTEENYIEIAQSKEDFTTEEFTQKWVDSLGGSVEIGRLKKDNAGTVSDIFIDDDGAEPVERDTARFPMKAEIEIMLDGLHGWDSENGEATDASVGIILEWSVDRLNWNKIPIDKWDTESTSILLDKGSSIENAFKMITGVSVNNIPFLTQNGIVMEIEPVNWKYGNRDIISILAEGNRIPVGWFVLITIHLADGSRVILSGANFGTDKNKTLPEPITLYRPADVITRRSTRQMRFLAKVDFSPYASTVYKKSGDPVIIRATRITRMHTGGYRDRVYLSAIRTMQYNPDLSCDTELVAAENINDLVKDKFCRLGIKIKVNQNTQEKLDQFNIIASMTGRTWDGENWSDKNHKTKTSNPAAVLLELMTGLLHDHSKHDDKELNLKSFGKLYEYCGNTGIFSDDPRKVLIDGEDEFVFELECNGVLTSGTKKIDAMRSILATCDGGLYINEYGEIIVTYDHYQSIPIALLNPQRIIKMSESRSLERKPDGYAVEFVDQEAGWSQNTYRVLRPDKITWAKNNPGEDKYAPLKLDFTTSYYQAMWHTRRIMAKEIHRPGEVKLTVGKEGRYYKPGSLIKVQHERFKIGLGSGEITEVLKEDGMIVGFKLMERFDIAKDRDYYIEYYVVDVDRNHVIYPQAEDITNPETKYRTMRLKRVEEGEYTDTLMLANPIPANNFYTPEYGNILSVIHSELKQEARIWESKRYLVSDMSEIEDGYELTLAQYSEDIYKIEPIQPYKSSILSAPPRVYDAMERMPIDGESGQGLPDNKSVSNVINNIVPEIIGSTTPSYRGAFYVVGTIIDGKGEIYNLYVNRNDWVLYLGEDQAGWKSGYCYRWTTEWTEIPLNDTAPYMAALADITAGKPNAAFSAAFVKDLFAQTVNAETVNVAMKLLIGAIKGKDEGIEIDGEKGIIQSKNYISVNDPQGRAPAGFILKKNKENDIQTEFTDIKTRNMEVSGNLNAMVSLRNRAPRYLYGGIRDYIELKKVNDNLVIIDTSITNVRISREDTGIYRLYNVHDDYVLTGEGFEVYSEMNFVGQGTRSYRKGLRINREEKYTISTSMGNSNSSLIHIREIGSNTLKDPFWAIIILLS